jgi:hypothetical protein
MMSLQVIVTFIYNFEMKKIIAFCLWGDNPRYNTGAILNAQIAKHLYSDWECRFYIASSVPESTLTALRDSDVQMMDSPGDWTTRTFVVQSFFEPLFLSLRSLSSGGQSDVHSPETIRKDTSISLPTGASAISFSISRISFSRAFE